MQLYLSERERHGVLCVCAADLNDVFELLGFGVESVVQRLKTRQKNLVDLLGSSDVHGGGERVIGALKHMQLHLLPIRQIQLV